MFLWPLPRNVGVLLLFSMRTLVCHDSFRVGHLGSLDILVYQHFSSLKGIDIVSMSETGGP